MKFAIALCCAAILVTFEGCGISDQSDSNVTLSVRVSSLVYLGDNNETNATLFRIGEIAVGSNFADSEKTQRHSYGRWDFYDANISGVRRVEKALFLNDINCSSYNIDTNTTAPTLSAPADGLSAYPYINVNPFTTLLVERNISAAQLGVEYPAAYAIDSDFNFDTVSALNSSDTVKIIGDMNLTQEICDALDEVIQLQNP